MAIRTHDQNTLKEGDWNTVCDVCEFKFKASDLRERWDGYMVCKEDYETRHPMDSQKGFADDQSVPYTRPDTDVVDAVTLHGNSTDGILYGTDGTIHEWEGDFSGSRAAVITDGTAILGSTLTIYKTGVIGDVSHYLEIFADGATLDTIAGDVKGVIVIEYNGLAWFVKSKTLLGL